MKFDETWSAVDLRVEAFSMKVEDFCQYKLSGGSSSLLGEAGKRVQGVVAPFQERLVNERRLQPSAGGFLCAGLSLHQYMIVRSFLNNKF